jgi:hypothetical protein
MDLKTFLWQSNLALLLFYAVYWVFLRRDTFFRWNRLYLLVALVFALAFPFLPVPTLFQEAVPEDQVLLFFGEETPIYQVDKVEAVASSPTLLTWENVLLAVYALGVLFFFIRLIINIFKIIKLIFPLSCVFTRKAIAQDYFIVQTPLQTPIFSFLNILFWNENPNISETEKAKILAHELVHIRQWHSLDVLFVEIVAVLFWYNPIIWAYKKSLQSIHEYLADTKVLEKEASKTEYANLLVSQFLQTDTLYLTNSFFNKSLLKNRIMMMYQTESKKKALVKYSFVVPILALCLLVAACSEKITKELTAIENPLINIHNQVIKIDLNSFTEGVSWENTETFWFVQNFKKSIKASEVVDLKLEILPHTFHFSKPLEIALARDRRLLDVIQRVENPSKINWERFAKYAQAGDRFIIELRPQKELFELPKLVARKRMGAYIESWKKNAVLAGYSKDEIAKEEQEIVNDFGNFLSTDIIFIVPIH